MYSEWGKILPVKVTSEGLHEQKKRPPEWKRILVKEEIEIQRSYRIVEMMRYQCPRCQWKQGSYSNFCPNCGLDLQEDF